jgi:hypothetical protein
MALHWPHMGTAGPVGLVGGAELVVLLLDVVVLLERAGVVVVDVLRVVGLEVATREVVVAFVIVVEDVVDVLLDDVEGAAPCAHCQ